MYRCAAAASSLIGIYEHNDVTLATYTIVSLTATMAYRAVTYAAHGAPSSVLKLATLPPLGAAKEGTVNVKFLMSPVNPADVNVVQGVYPVKSRTSVDGGAWVGGNEGVAEVLTPAKGLEVGDWVIPCTPQMGTWRAQANLGVQDVAKVRSRVVMGVDALSMCVCVGTQGMGFKARCSSNCEPCDGDPACAGPSAQGR